HGDDDDEEVDLGQRHAIEQDLHRLGHRLAHGLLVEDALELGPDRLLGLLGDNAHGIVERQTGLDAADNDFHGVGQFVEELALIRLAAVREVHLVQQVACSGREDGGVVPFGDEEQQDEYGDAQDHLVADEGGALDLEAGLKDLVLQRHALAALFEQLGLLLEGLLDFLAAGIAGAGGVGLAPV